MRLQDKVAIVTGGGSGFGEGIAKAYAREGAAIVVADIGEAGGLRVVEEIKRAGGKAVFARADVSKRADMDQLLATALEQFGKLDIVVNNAGTTHRNRPMLEVEEEEFDRVYAVNVKSIFLSAKTFVPYFRKVGGGAFVNIASTAGVRPRPGLTWYNGSKGAVITTSKSMAAELGPDKIRVNCVNPVISATGLLAEFMGVPDTPENRKKFVATIPMGRFSTPEDIANACLYLGSDEAQFVTGVCIEVDGGRCV
ncbi:3-ketoacyl-(acyl-carrier-protein) reductase [Herbaspirillum frisingense GSF30]|uniref:3-ketoacyl-(Acyl-carrier-protein) reductase n=1 Tax=Herbaspirillum frisingense GSF30 TaxID=864073 RepID=A0AAI9N2J5_9BURK|nr:MULTISPECIES: SDR family oxidoreductase [Herbaspirillum]EOA03367.1 3-ketoacyl-(acyl-carrier-protein) reductase [Herbaspirillum frisingense GSF30]MCI1016560.1 SDR family oxidoreductase [Herbaspirillum sp. C7C2]ONN65648.1 3-oxoacyl-ACP reductase [Herbaspirillum sp. VT-16-41]HZG18765.1 SDR family oxidoreductase [Herbaspirillum sp.]